MDSRNTTLPLALLCLTLGASATPFTSIHVFGDGVSTTTDNISPTPKYGNRYCNGRVWIEVLSEWQGLAYTEANNNSYFGHDSTELLTSTTNFTAPGDVATALTIVWINNADLVEYLFATTGDLPYDNNNGDDDDGAAWATFIADATSNHQTALTTLYNKGVRTIVLPEAVDVTLTPRFLGLDATSKDFIRDRVDDFNASLATMADNLTGSLAGLTIHIPKTADFIEDVVTNPANYGVGNPTLAAFITEPVLDGPGADYVWWDLTHPTAKVQMYLANLVQQQICPITITNISLSGGNTHITLDNIPLERDGSIEGLNGPGPWTEDTSIFESFASGSTTQTISFPTPSDPRLQRANFPVDWSWP